MIQNMQQGAVHISMSTILPLTAEELSKQHIKRFTLFVGPGMAGAEAARTRKLNFVVSGEATLRQRFEQLLKDAGGAGVWDLVMLLLQPTQLSCVVTL